MSWFKNIFLQSFKDGETPISEKQYNIFARNLKGESFIDGYIAGYVNTIDGRRIKAYSWNAVGGTRYYVDIETIQ